VSRATRGHAVDAHLRGQLVGELSDEPADGELRGRVQRSAAGHVEVGVGDRQDDAALAVDEADDEAVIDDLCNAEIQLSAVSESGSAAVARTGASIFIVLQSRLDSLLTKREVEVLSLMSDGSTNAAIANELVISEGTVKSHVKRILHKLRASNRAEAVSRYLRLAIREER
jgi:DNA-binding NarL/FixJ family response regulator